MDEDLVTIRPASPPASMRLHRRLGFAEVGRLRRVGHKHGRWLDTVLLRRSLQTT